MSRERKAMLVPREAVKAGSDGKVLPAYVTMLEVIVQKDQISPREDVSRLFKPGERTARWWPGDFADGV
jgi:hypothetical protein